MRRLTCMGVLGFVLASSIAGTAAAADRMNDGGRFVVSGERLFGVAWVKETTSVGGMDQSESITSISLLTKQAEPNPFAAPRIAFDGFVVDGLSLGGSVGYSNFSISESGITSGDGPSYHAWLISPRIGYAYMFNDTVGLWPRLGITYVNQTVSASATVAGTNVSADSSSHFVALSAEVPLAFTPVPHTLITIAPTLDWGFSGSTGAGNGSADVTAIGLGLHAGLGIWF
jgi:hypothetical protein